MMKSTSEKWSRTWTVQCVVRSLLTFSSNKSSHLTMIFRKKISLESSAHIRNTISKLERREVWMVRLKIRQRSLNETIVRSNRLNRMELSEKREKRSECCWLRNPKRHDDTTQTRVSDERMKTSKYFSVEYELRPWLSRFMWEDSPLSRRNPPKAQLSANFQPGPEWWGSIGGFTGGNYIGSIWIKSKKENEKERCKLVLKLSRGRAVCSCFGYEIVCNEWLKFIFHHQRKNNLQKSL